MGCHALLQGIFPIQGSDPGLPHCRQILCRLNYQGVPKLNIFLHMSVWLFLDQINIWIYRLPCPVWVGIIQSVEDLNRTKRWRREEFTPSASCAPAQVGTSAFCSPTQQPSSQAFGLQLEVTPPTPLVLGPLLYLADTDHRTSQPP